ncbi:hypothetical protein NL676_019522 [Syzygium grande]|nr:hypothetical protein NL676_019522 [Syzygium grande]
MACMQEEAMKENGSAVKSQEALLLPPRRGRIKSLVFACLFQSFKAPVAQLFGAALRCGAPTADQKPPRSSSSLARRWFRAGKCLCVVSSGAGFASSAVCGCLFSIFLCISISCTSFPGILGDATDPFPGK